MPKKMKGIRWYHTATTGDSGSIFFIADDDDDPWQDANGGPFPTFEAARADAIIYHQVDIAHARAAIRELRAMRAPKKK